MEYTVDWFGFLKMHVDHLQRFCLILSWVIVTVICKIVCHNSFSAISLECCRKNVPTDIVAFHPNGHQHSCGCK
ncbi:hypothetical protein RRG08_025364 [Elysia crispata]|uniref:Uncharacterized protein n=1 Tax=Elysia crispata TaxID=231223 RepID=A0AAE1B4J8_9GAST|nr:hypothetical protein RRG08_025364 [Elysia crispata]